MKEEIKMKEIITYLPLLLSVVALVIAMQAKKISKSTTERQKKQNDIHCQK